MRPPVFPHRSRAPSAVAFTARPSPSNARWLESPIDPMEWAGLAADLWRRECRSCRDAKRTEQGEAKHGEAMQFVNKHTRSSISKLHKRPGDRPRITQR